MKIILSLYDPTEGSGVEYAFLDITPELAQTIAERYKQFQSVPGAHEISFLDSSVEFLEDLPDGIEVPNINDGGDYDETEISPDDLEQYHARMDCQRMILTQYKTVYWAAYPHYLERSVLVETNPIDIQTILDTSSTEAAA